jgi:hypothetical protein
MLSIGIVVRSHPGDHSYDLLMSDGRRLIGVQKLTHDASTRSGTFDMPNAPEKTDPWDVQQETGQELKAVISYIAGGHPIIVGFLTPQISQMTFDDPLLRVQRHQSDVMSMIDGDGNIQLSHPSGTYLRIGVTPEAVDLTGKNTDANLAIDRNTDKPVHVHIGLAGGVASLDIAPNGAVSIATQSTASISAVAGVTIETLGPAVLSAMAVAINSPETVVSGSLHIGGALSYAGGMTGSGDAGGGATAVLSGNVQVAGDINATGYIHGDG